MYPYNNHTPLYDPYHPSRPPPYPPFQYPDEAAAASAVRNLNGVEVNDRSLRIEASSDTPNHRQAGRGSGAGAGGGGGGGGGARGPPPRRSPPPPFRPPPPGAGYGMPPPGAGGYGGPPPPMPMGGPPGPGRVDLGMLPPGIELPRGENALDGITKTLGGISPGQLQDVMAGMKVSQVSLRSSNMTRANNPGPNINPTGPSTSTPHYETTTRIRPISSNDPTKHCRSTSRSSKSHFVC
jgi:cleavage stimulation factor subunit 2